MQRWEYKVQAFSGSQPVTETEQSLNQLGQEGWEVVGVIPITFGGGGGNANMGYGVLNFRVDTDYRVIFKRPKP